MPCIEGIICVLLVLTHVDGGATFSSQEFMGNKACEEAAKWTYETSHMWEDVRTKCAMKGIAMNQNDWKNE